MLAYVVYMLLNKDKKVDVFYSKRRVNEPDMSEYSSKDVRVVVCVMLVCLFGPNKLSVLFNLMHRKTVTQLQFTIIFTIVFIINCFDDSFDYSGIVFLQRERQDRQARLFGDIYYGFSTQRSSKILLNVCYGIFDLVLYPNALFFAAMVSMFFFVVVMICLITFTNWLGLTAYNLEDRNRNPTRRTVGLQRHEMMRLKHEVYSETTPKQKR